MIAGHTGIGLSQRMQSFDLDPSESPFNVVAPGRASCMPKLDRIWKLLTFGASHACCTVIPNSTTLRKNCSRF